MMDHTPGAYTVLLTHVSPINLIFKIVNALQQ